MKTYAIMKKGITGFTAETYLCVLFIKDEHPWITSTTKKDMALFYTKNEIDTIEPILRKEKLEYQVVEIEHNIKPSKRKHGDSR